MAQVIALSDVRQARRINGRGERSPTREYRKPALDLAAMLSMDYSGPDGVLAGLTRILRALRWDLDWDGEWRDKVLDLLDAVAAIESDGYGPFHEAVSELKHYVAMNTTQENRHTLGTASIVLELMEKSLAQKYAANS